MCATLFLKMGQIGCPEASLYQPTFYNIAEKRRLRLHLRREACNLAVLNSGHMRDKNTHTGFLWYDLK
jgi:hypothetical protein